jgi:hypothetical protein
MPAAIASSDEVVGLHRLFGDAVDGVLENLALTASHVYRYCGGAPTAMDLPRL